jgi:uncharacterized protein
MMYNIKNYKTNSSVKFNAIFAIHFEFYMINHNQNILKFKGGLAWNDYSSHIKSQFGVRVQKISVNAGFTCPNRDGTKGRNGCIYCNNSSFSPFYCKPETPIAKQLEKGIDFFGKKYKTQKYLAYFQSGTNTYAPTEILLESYKEALSVPGVLGLVIGTRPDCIDESTLEILKEIAKEKYVCIEFGVESSKNESLKIINRGHSWEDTVKAIHKTAKAGIKTGLHIILGLPGETENDFLKHASKISELPVNLLKIHQMQILKNTELEKLYINNPEMFIKFTPESYAETIVRFCEILNPDIIIERFTSESPRDILIAPDWRGKKNFEVSHIISKKFNEMNSWQGKRFFC